MADKKWVIGVLPGVGELAFWIENDFLEPKYTGHDGDAIKHEVENLSKVLTGPNGQVGFQRVGERAWIDIRQTSVLIDAPPEMIQSLSKLWDMKAIVLPSTSDRLKLIR